MTISHVVLQETSRDYRTEIPNIVDEMVKLGFLSFYAFRLYSVYRRIAGEHGKCWVGTRGLAEHCGFSPTKVTEAKKELSQAFIMLQGKSLIQIQPGSKKMETADTVYINDIWADNYAHFKNKVTCAKYSTPVCQIQHTPVPNIAHKKEPIKKEPNKKQQQVVVPAAPKDFCKSDVQRIALTKEWTFEEVDKAFEIYEKSRHIVTHPLEYIEGIIEKNRVIAHAKQNKKEKSCSTPQKPLETLQEKRERSRKKLLELDMQTNTLETYVQSLTPKYKTSYGGSL